MGVGVHLDVLGAWVWIMVWPSVSLLLACFHLVSLSMLVLESMREREKKEKRWVLV
jgi:hypothetical protein